MTPRTPRPNRPNTGFTLAEIILVVAVMAILVSLSTPPIIEFLKRRDIQNEQNALVDITKAMKSYLVDRNSLPPSGLATTCGGTAPTWAVSLARYSNLSANQMACDVWNRPRAFIAFARPETFLGTSMNVYYASVHSSGPDLVADGASQTAGGDADSTLGISVSGNNFGSVSGTAWWAGITDDDDKMEAFVAMQPADDDQLIRFTDYPDKVEKYKVSLERLERIAIALESYSKTKYNEAVVYCSTTSCTTPPEQFIYYPRADSAGSPADQTSYYHSYISADLGTYNGGSAPNYNGIDNSTNNNNRRTDMINLMRLLGLPDEYCCNALETFEPSAGAKPVEMPFYYYSNPRPRNTSGGCQSTRPNPTASGAAGRTLPARLTITSTNACG